MMSNELYINLEWLLRVPDDFNEQMQFAAQEKEPGMALRKLAGYRLSQAQQAGLGNPE